MSCVVDPSEKVNPSTLLTVMVLLLDLVPLISRTVLTWEKNADVDM
jgi:hypothetical protein